LKKAGETMLPKEKLINAAKKVSENAYAPYSGFQVGAALLTKSGKIFTGCNVENASYGLSNCAERTAVFKAVSEGEKEFAAIAIYTNTEQMFTPCGACRQVLAEFDNEMMVIVSNGEKTVEFTISKLLPHHFSI
jgi:cytidine deaminase